MREERLPGGFVNEVVRVGDTVRRALTPRSGFVHELLELFERRGWAGAPRFLGTDGQGREMLGYLPGLVAWQPDQSLRVASEAGLVSVVELVREFHDLTAGTPLAEGGEVVCHNDLSPKNTVYRERDGGPRAMAFIDWDIAAPGARIHDVAHVCWQYVNLGPEIADVGEAARSLRLVCDVYGLDGKERLVETILWWQDRCSLGIAAGAAAGDPAMTRLRDEGVVRTVRDARRWVTEHRHALERHL
ncbi:phosphotransferase family protein [Nonomuraea sp. C10]|uniref:phosphotransferase family protein n=1 Tax=Nonomuraea sp. C10 TaxID=2600577 RepID=UPI0011CD8149|nr:phosphotransferase [Nonomuraea sp. C10]TXK38240.1 phosphotransferase [Nonomuraea sp. C10]